MVLYLIEMFGVSLLLTLIIELTVAGWFKIPWGKDMLPVVLVNVLTNPVVVMICWLWRLYISEINIYWIQIPVELIVVGSEFLIYKSLIKSGWECENPFRFSVVANGCSWLFGVFISFVK